MSKSLIPWRRKDESVTKRWDDSHPFEALHRQMNELFEGFFDDFGLAHWPVPRSSMSELAGLSPRFEVSETDDAIQVTAELPGMDEKDIEVTLENSLLTVKGEKKSEREEKKKNYYFTERSYGHFQRVVPLPTGVEEEEVKAKFKKGVLSITLPKTEQAKKQGKRIDVTAE